MKRFKVTYTETKDITAFVDAENPQEAQGKFHEERADGGYEIRYSGEITELEEINMFDESEENPKEENDD